MYTTAHALENQESITGAIDGRMAWPMGSVAFLSACTLHALFHSIELFNRTDRLRPYHNHRITLTRDIRTLDLLTPPTSHINDIKHRTHLPHESFIPLV